MSEEKKSAKKLRARTYKSPIVKPAEVQRKWFVFDAKGKTLGRFASEISKVLRGRHRPDFTSTLDMGDGVIVINAEKIKVTGSKEARKKYTYYTGYIGGHREVPFSVMRDRKPTYILQHAVKGMMPKTKIGRRQMTRLRLVVGDQHNMNSQQAIEVNA